MSLFEVNEAAAIIKETAHPEVNLIFGAVIDEDMRDQIRITVIATGFERPSGLGARAILPPPTTQRSSNRPGMGQPMASASAPQPRQSVPVESPAPRQPAAPPPAPAPMTPAPQPRQSDPREARENRDARDNNPYNSDDLDIPTFLRKR
jgi:cell division protein FtsZ